jgi:hypothetical protein
MTIPTKVEINCATGVISEVPLNDDELAQLEKDRKAAEADRVKREADAKKLEDLKESAKTKLIAGEALTDEEASTLIV